MSMHKIPLTPLEESGLKAHGLDIGTPSQLSDAFRQGVAWASESLRQQLAECQAREAKRINWLRTNASHSDNCDVLFLDKDDKHMACSCGLESALSQNATALNELIAKRTKTQKEYYESVFQDGANRIAELTAEVERLKGEQYVQLDIHTDDTRTKQQRELDGAMEVGQLLADSENSTASNSAFKGTEHLTWVHTGNGYISDSSGRFIGAFSGDFRNRDRFICAVNSENQLRQQNAELTAQRDALLSALDTTVKAIMIFRNEPMLERLHKLRNSDGYGVLQQAMYIGLDVIDTIITKNKPQ